MSESNVIEHWPDWRPDDQATEYVLPCLELPENVRSGLHPWLRDMIGLQRENVQQIVQSRWSDIEEERLKRLRDIAIEYQAKSIVVFRNRGWLLLERPSLGALPQELDDPAYNQLLVPPATNNDVIDAGVTRFGGRDSALLKAFLRSFGGCRDMVPNTSGNYSVPEEWSTLFDYWGDFKGWPGSDVRWYEEWRGALIVYIATCGDMVLLHPTGKVAWLLFDIAEIRLIANDFQGFLDYVIRHRRVTPVEYCYSDLLRGSYAENASEYLLPCLELPESTRSGLHPWLRDMIGLQSENVQQIVQARWADIEEEPLKRLRDIALEYRPKSIVVFRGSAWLVLERPSSDERPQQLLLPPPPNDNAIDSGVARFAGRDSTLLNAFLRAFGGCREIVPDMCGNYRIPGEWKTPYDYWGKPAALPGFDVRSYDEWNHALIVYVAIGGNMVLLHPTGKMAWLRFGKIRDPIFVIADDFHGFLEYLIRHQRVTPVEAMNEQEQRVCDLIQAAFAGVTLGAGVGLRQAQGIDDYADARTLASLRAGDEKRDWSAIPVADLDNCYSSLSFFDAEGMRFHLPAYLVADLAGTLRTASPMFHLVHLVMGMEVRYELLSPNQREAIREYLLLRLSDPNREFDHPMIRAALETYWAAPSRS